MAENLTPEELEQKTAHVFRAENRAGCQEWSEDYIIPEEPAEPGEIEAIAEAKADKSPTIPHDAIDWD